ncbi:hypothetical protein BK809_0000192 [Diplodia seriata]|uniref:Ankyrin repeat protein n=1 Tax=Diplodia seriata TaxID=420778 RepID=A0A1S8BAW1_9PEZI|nr:hypothetical protein BK809_0000192 [Diplodia seriata]
MRILDDIKDIRDELNIISSVVQEQKPVWSQLFNQPRGSSIRDDGYESRQWSNTNPSYVLKRVDDLLQEARETERNIISVLELQMNQLNVVEAEDSRKQGRILMGFTVVTVLFLPLSFLASLFALNVSTFPHSGDEVQYQPGWIFGIMCKFHKCTEERYLTHDLVGATLAFILLLLILVREDLARAMAEGLKRQFKAALSTKPHPHKDKSTAGGESSGSFKDWCRKKWRQWRRRPGDESV